MTDGRVSQPVVDGNILDSHQSTLCTNHSHDMCKTTATTKTNSSQEHHHKSKSGREMSDTENGVVVSVVVGGASTSMSSEQRITTLPERKHSQPRPCRWRRRWLVISPWIVGATIFNALSVVLLESLRQQQSTNNHHQHQHADVLPQAPPRQPENLFRSNRSAATTPAATANRTATHNSTTTAAATATTKGPTMIAFVISITACQGLPVADAAAVLAYSIDRVHNNNRQDNDIDLLSFGNRPTSRYDYSLYVLYLPKAAACVAPLEQLGYTLLERNLSYVDDITSKEYRQVLETDGVSGADELIKLEAYTLVEHPLVVFLDLDTMVLKPMDDIFDAMLEEQPSKGISDPNGAAPTTRLRNVLQNPNQTLPTNINLAFTYDYNLLYGNERYKPIQGGFFILRPSLQVYDEFRNLVIHSDYRTKGGWGNGTMRRFWGSATIQGLLPYYYDMLHPGQSLELNRCIYNQMADDPTYWERDRHGKEQEYCKTGERACEDCRGRDFADVVSVHYTITGKPWTCVYREPHNSTPMRRNMIRKWFLMRARLEQQSWGRRRGTGQYYPNYFFGYCAREGSEGYQLMLEPYGGPTNVNLTRDRQGAWTQYHVERRIERERRRAAKQKAAGATAGQRQ